MPAGLVVASLVTERAAEGVMRVVVGGLADALRSLLDRPDELAAARDGATRARKTLTWDAAAEAHLALYEEIR